jgi:hypothetical protein|tara:strand:- start:329 stop:505 length:177 start_codon:yes stop_codon:yes gene_type:complete
MHPSLKKPLAILTVITLSSAAIIYNTHWKQSSDRAIMHQGVIRDIEREKLRLEQQEEK